MGDGRLQGRRAVVTGAARGIGLAIAQRLAAEGCATAIVDIDADALAGAADAFAAAGLGQPVTLHADIGDPASVRSMADQARTALGGLDILVNNAAVLDSTPLEALSPERFDQVIAVNLRGALLCTQALVSELSRSPAPRIVNVASINGLRGTKDSIAYDTAKAGLVNLTRCLAVDLGPRGIVVNAVAPGFVDTRMALTPSGKHEYDTDRFRDIYLKHGRILLGRVAQPGDIAGPVAFLCSDDSAYVTGQVLIVDGGVTATF